MAIRARVFKQKPAIIVRNIVIAELIAYLAFTLLALTADWGELYETVALARYLPFEIVEFSILGIVQLLIIFGVFWWASTNQYTLDEFLTSDEHGKLEFKTSLRWDIKEQKVNKALEKSVFKTAAAFMNSDGGNILIGVGNKGEVIGLESDFKTLNRPDADGFENHFNNLFSAMIGSNFRQFVNLEFHEKDGQQICLIRVQSSPKPVYLRLENGTEDFYVRTGNATTPLKMSEVATYISSWWK